MAPVEPATTSRPRPSTAPPAAPSPAEQLRAALVRQPQDHDTRLKLAGLLLSAGEVVPAETELRLLIKVKSHHQRAGLLLVRLLRAVWRLEEAVKLGKEHMAAYPKDVEGHKQLGMALLAWRARHLAATQIQQGLKLAPDRADLWRVLGEIYLKWRRLKPATEALERAVKLDGNNPWPLTLLGDAYWGQSRVRTAERAYRKAAGLTGGPPVFRAVALDKLGTLLVSQRRYQTARAVHQACRKLFPHLGCPYTRAALLPPNPVYLPAMRPVATYN
jgi:tetratricopeptide (TPR) repeat protein